MPDITFRVAQWQDKPVLSRLLELYQYDLSEVWPQTLNEHGEYGFAVDRYLRNPRLRAYFFLVDGDYEPPRLPRRLPRLRRWSHHEEVTEVFPRACPARRAHGV